MLPRIKRRDIIFGLHALYVATVEGNGVVNISRVQEWENVVKVFRVA